MVRARAPAARRSGRKCPFAAMLQRWKARPETVAATTRAERARAHPGPVDSAAERLANIPAFVRPMARTGIERFAQERGALEVDETILDAARDFFGM